jgi:hypothetical protein
VKSSATLAIVLTFITVGPLGRAQTSLSGAEAVREVDWSAISVGSPIPDLMPIGDADDPLEAGFAPQWLERVGFVQGFVSPSRQFALHIVSLTRSPDDRWSLNMRRSLSTLVRSSVPNAMNVRVFCNAIGCLCYVEREEPYVLGSIVYGKLWGKSGRELHLSRSDLVDAWTHVHGPGRPWELTIIRSPNVPSSSSPTQSRP